MAYPHFRLVADPVISHNPVGMQVLGLCSALAVTSSLAPAITMACAVFAVLVFANVAVSLLRRLVPGSVRLIVEMMLIATAVMLVDQVLLAFMPDLAAVLSVFVGLIVTNCIVLGRTEGFALHHGVLESLLDGIGNGLGYGLVLISIGAFRELFGSGSLLGYPVLPLVSEGGWYTPNQLLVLTPGAFFLVALLVWVLRSVAARRARRQLAGREPAAGHLHG